MTPSEYRQIINEGDEVLNALKQRKQNGGTQEHKPTETEAGEQWSQYIAAVVQQQVRALTAGFGQALGEAIAIERDRMRAEVEAKINERLVAILTGHDNGAPPAATLDRKGADRIVDRCVDATRDYVRDRIADEHKAFTQLLDGESAMRKSAITMAIKALKTEIKTIINNAVLPLKCELATATSSIVKSWRVDREAYTLTATMVDGSACEIDLRGLFEQFQADTE